MKYLKRLWFFCLAPMLTVLVAVVAILGIWVSIFNGDSDDEVWFNWDEFVDFLDELLSQFTRPFR